MRPRVRRRHQGQKDLRIDRQSETIRRCCDVVGAERGRSPACPSYSLKSGTAIAPESKIGAGSRENQSIVPIEGWVQSFLKLAQETKLPSCDEAISEY